MRRSNSLSLCLLLAGAILLNACESDKDTHSPVVDNAAETGSGTTEVVDLPELAEPEPIDWTAPAGDSYEDAIVAYDQARESKIGEHPGYVFAGNIWERMAADDHPPSQYHLGLLHYFGNGGREFNHNLTGEYVKKSASAGYPLANSFMAFHNENGDGTLFLKSDSNALENWQLAADGGHCSAIKRIIKVYTDGELGAKADPARVADLEKALPNCTKR